MFNYYLTIDSIWLHILVSECYRCLTHNVTENWDRITSPQLDSWVCLQLEQADNVLHLNQLLSGTIKPGLFFLQTYHTVGSHTSPGLVHSLRQLPLWYINGIYVVSTIKIVISLFRTDQLFLYFSYLQVAVVSNPWQYLFSAVKISICVI